MRGGEGPGSRAFTLMEVLTAVGIIVILIVLLIPAYSALHARAQRAQCTANLKSLYVAANVYVQQNGSWPQIRHDPNSDTSSEDFALAWVGVLAPFGPTSKTWICPTIQEALGSPDYTQPADARIDYMPMLFDDKPTTSHEWPRAPWFVEVGDVHGSGNLIIYTDGSISDFDALRHATQGR